MDAQAEFQRSVVEELRPIRVVGPELKFPVFSGVGDDAEGHPLDWLSRAERFFAFYKVPEDQKVGIASYHLQRRDASEWLILYERSTVLTPSSSWDHFVDNFLTHFGGYGGDIDGALLRLNQDGRVNDYITDFLRLMSRASKKKWRTDDQLKGLFINGLQEVLRSDVLLYNPETLSEAIDLARALKVEEGDDFFPQPEQFIPDLPRYRALFMGKTRVKLLMSGSSHNFISSSIVKKGGAYRRLIIKEDDPLVVESLAGGGDTITTEGRIDGAQVNLQGYKFAADFYVLPNLTGCDIMLGGNTFPGSNGIVLSKDSLSVIANGRHYRLTPEKHPPGTITQSCCLSLMATTY